MGRCSPSAGSSGSFNRSPSPSDSTKVHVSPMVWNRESMATDTIAIDSGNGTGGHQKVAERLRLRLPFCALFSRYSRNRHRAHSRISRDAGSSPGTNTNPSWLGHRPNSSRYRASARERASSSPTGRNHPVRRIHSPTRHIRSDPNNACSAGATGSSTSSEPGTRVTDASTSHEPYSAYDSPTRGSSSPGPVTPTTAQATRSCRRANVFASRLAASSIT